jgi:hypothetical protein
MVSLLEEVEVGDGAGCDLADVEVREGDEDE